MQRVICALFAVTLVGGCGPSGKRAVTVKGQDTDLMSIAGRWYGTYEASGGGRKGTVTFELYKGTRVAEGEVVMNADSPELAKTLSIEFVSVGRNEIRGKIGPYEAPNKQKVTTVFRGKVHGDKITGAFVTKTVDGVEAQRGKWKVVRKEK
jgi:hypothetical protein